MADPDRPTGPYSGFAVPEDRLAHGREVQLSQVDTA